nr:MAG TPA: hypothetical protein [Caudoviricetes sp.]
MSMPTCRPESGRWSTLSPLSGQKMSGKRQRGGSLWHQSEEQ